MRTSVLWFWGSTTPSSMYSQWSVLTAMPTSSSPQAPKTLLSSVSARLLQELILPAGRGVTGGRYGGKMGV